MNRRTYLGLAAAGAIGSIAGCAEATDGREFPPYPDSNTTELSGSGRATSESFELSLDGPTLIDLTHTGEENFTVILDTPPGDDDELDGNETASPDGNETAEVDDNSTTDADDDDLDIEVEEGGQIVPVATIASARGAYDGRTLHAVDSGRYVLHVIEADDDWEATVYDLPEYDDGVGVELPIERDGEQYDVIGPIDFGEQTTVDFEFVANGEGLHRVFLNDRTGTEPLSVAEFEGEDSESVSQEIAGVGYIEVLTIKPWTLHLS